MTRSRSLIKMFGRMTIFGIFLGAVAGFLVGVALLIMSYDPTYDSLPEFVMGTLTVSFVWGGMFGGMYGGASGLFAGLAMAFFTAVGYGTIQDTKSYKRTMGVITAVITSSIFIFGGLFALGMDMGLPWISAMVLSVVIAVYASQITAKKYLAEITVRKEKAKAS